MLYWRRTLPPVCIHEHNHELSLETSKGSFSCLINKKSSLSSTTIGFQGGIIIFRIVRACITATQSVAWVHYRAPARWSREAIDIESLLKQSFGTSKIP